MLLSPQAKAKSFYSTIGISPRGYSKDLAINRDRTVQNTVTLTAFNSETASFAIGSRPSLRGTATKVC
jgi:hypothetical protein